MRPRDLEPVIRDALGAHAVLRRMGFATDDLFVAVQRHTTCGNHHLFVILRTQGREFNYDAGELDLGSASIETWIERVANAYSVWNTAPQHERDWIYENCYARENLPLLLAAVMDKGIEPPGGNQ